MNSVRNIVVVALMQIGVIVGGVLAAGLWHQYATINELPMPVPAAILYHYGYLGFLIPIGWSLLTLAALRQSEISDEWKAACFWFGVLILAAIISWVGFANISPFFRIMWRLNDDHEY